MFGKRELRNLNRRIENIKSAGLQPITLKSPADLMERFIHEKGTGKEGTFKTYAEYTRQYGYIDEQLFYNMIEDFFDLYKGQLNVKGAKAYAATRARELLIDRFGYSYDIDVILDMKDKDLYDLISKVGRETNERVRNGETSDVFYYLLEEYLEDMINTSY